MSHPNVLLQPLSELETLIRRLRASGQRVRRADTGCSVYSEVRPPLRREIRRLHAVFLDREHGPIHFEDVARELSITILTNHIPALHCFEREVHEQYGLAMPGHPWPADPFRGAQLKRMNDYPFYKLLGKRFTKLASGRSMPA
jgi:hypothetical protein